MPIGVRRRALVSNLALSGASLLFFVLLLEVGLRLARVDMTVPGLEVRRLGGGLIATFKTEHFVQDPRLVWAPRKGQPPFNELGYRGPVAQLPKPAGELRILAVGDSNTLGHAESWVNELTSTVRPQVFGAQRVAVVNAGVYGYTSYQGRLRLRDFEAYSPDLVLISFGGNDGTPNAVPDHSLPMSRLDATLERWSAFSRTIGLVRYAAYRRQRGGKPVPAASSVPRVSLEEYRDNLKDMIATARRMGARPILLTRPFSYDYYGDPAQPVTRYYRATFEVGAAEGVSVIDVHRMMGCYRLFYQDHSHFNGRGHREAARLVGAALEQINERGSYDADELTHRPPDAEYARLLGVLQTKIPLWISAAKARQALSEVASDRGRRTLFDFASTRTAEGWRGEGPEDQIRAAGSALCLSSPTRAPAVVYDLPQNESRLRFVWLEADGRVEGVALLYWDTGSGFSENQVVNEQFAGPVDQRPYRFNFLLPREARRVRLTMRPAGSTSACLRELWVEEFVPRTPPEGL